MNELSTQVSAAEALSMLGENKSKYATGNSLAAVTSASSYLPYLTLIGSSSKEGKKDPMKIGKFALSRGKDKMDMLGDTIPCFLMAWRPKAMRYKPKALSYFNPQSDAFQKVQAEAEADRRAQVGFGPELLIWLPDVKEYCTYFLGNITGRQEAPNMISLIEKRVHKCKLKAHLIETKDYAWHGPQTLNYDLDIAMPTDSGMMLEILKKFNNPPESQEVEAASPEAAAGSRD